MLYLSLAQVSQGLIFFLYNVVLVSAAQQNNSVISKYSLALLLSTPPISRLGLFSYSKTNSTRALHSNSYLLHNWYMPLLQVSTSLFSMTASLLTLQMGYSASVFWISLKCINMHTYILLLYLVATNLNRCV